MYIYITYNYQQREYIYIVYILNIIYYIILYIIYYIYYIYINDIFLFVYV